MRPNAVFRNVDVCPYQSYLGRGIHTLGVIDWLLEQTGKADIIVTTFSTSIEFVSGFNRLKAQGLVGTATLVADVKASKKTWRLDNIIKATFDSVYLAENHSKVVLLFNERYNISVITSQNQTYGGRIEVTMISTDKEMFRDLKGGVDSMIDSSLKIR